MRGVIGNSMMGVDQWVGPTDAKQTHRARFVEHAVARGPAPVQDLGNANSKAELSFHFDEGFCDPETELDRIKSAWINRTPLDLFIEMQGFQAETYVIQTLEVSPKKYSPSGRLVRVEMRAELLSGRVSGGGFAGLALGFAGAILAPLVRR